MTHYKSVQKGFVRIPEKGGKIKKVQVDAMILLGGQNSNPDIERVAAKPTLPGRNDPCSCGSGLKFKRCCEA